MVFVFFSSYLESISYSFLLAHSIAVIPFTSYSLGFEHNLVNLEGWIDIYSLGFITKTHDNIVNRYIKADTKMVPFKNKTIQLFATQLFATLFITLISVLLQKVSIIVRITPEADIMIDALDSIFCLSSHISLNLLHVASSSISSNVSSTIVSPKIKVTNKSLKIFLVLRC